MTTYVGEGIAILCAATDPASGAQVSTADAIVECFAPPKNPAKVAGDRVVDKGPFAMSFDDTVVNKDGTTGAYVAYIDTTNWAAGKWHYRVTLSGAYESWEYSSFVLRA